MEALNKRNITEVMVEGDFTSDKKNKLNRSDVKVSEETLSQIENGCPIEVLEALDLPIYFYNTQITIHGYFPSLNTNSIGMYKNIIQNNNKSIGIKYSAIDWNKKSTIIKAVRLVEDNSYKCGYDSTSFYVYSAKEVKDTKEVKTAVEYYKNELKKFGKDLVMGDFSIFLSTVYGVTYCVLKINVNAIYEKNLFSFISLISTFNSREEFEAAVLEKDKKDKLESEARHLEYKERIAKDSQVRKEKYEELVKNLKKTTTIIDNSLYISHTDDYHVVVFKVCKNDVWRFTESDYSDNSELYESLNKRNKKNKLDEKKSKIVLNKISTVGLFLFK